MEAGNSKFRLSDGFGDVREFAPGDEVVLRRGCVPGTVIRRVQDSRHGVPRYSVRTADGTRIADVNGMRQDARERTAHGKARPQPCRHG